MGWSNLHVTTNGTGGQTIETGYWEETINLLDWRIGQAGDGLSAYTSSIPISADKDFTVLMDFSADAPADLTVSVEHSHDGTTWTTAAQSGTTAMSTADFTGGTNISVLAVIDDGSQAENTTGYYFVYDPETHGSSKFIRFGIADPGNFDESGNTVTYRIIPH